MEFGSNAPPLPVVSTPSKLIGFAFLHGLVSRMPVVSGVVETMLRERRVHACPWEADSEVVRTLVAPSWTSLHVLSVIRPSSKPPSPACVHHQWPLSPTRCTA